MRKALVFLVVLVVLLLVVLLVILLLVGVRLQIQMRDHSVPLQEGRKAVRTCMPRTEKEVRESLWLRHLNPFQPRDYRYRQCKYFKNYTNPPLSHAHARSCPHSNFYLHHHMPTPVLVDTPTFTPPIAFLPSSIARVRCCLLLRCGCLFFWCWVVARSSFAPRAQSQRRWRILSTSH